jgi:hypothetical protein
MSWFMPSWGRPHKFAQLLEAPGGWPPEVIVQVNEDDPLLNEYKVALRGRPWYLDIVPAGLRCSDVHRLTYEKYPFEENYGFLMDDLWPITKHWWALLISAASDHYFAIPQGPGYPKRIRSAFCMGGDLVRAMGSVVPIPLRHWCEDCVWDDIAATLGLMRPVKKAIVDHRNFEFGLVPVDKTYERGREFIKHDEELFAKWMVSTERTELLARVSAMLESEYAQFPS